MIGSSGAMVTQGGSLLWPSSVIAPSMRAIGIAADAGVEVAGASVPFRCAARGDASTRSVLAVTVASGSDDIRAVR